MGQKGVFDETAPDYRLVGNGLNIQGKCRKCGYIVVSRLGYNATKFDPRDCSKLQKEKFDINYIYNELPCSNCVGVIDEEKIDMFIFRNCKTIRKKY